MNYFPEQVFIGLQEVPNEISLIIPIAGCSRNCKGCHSPEYRDASNGVQLTNTLYLELLDKYRNKVSCICFFAGEFEVEHLLLEARRRGFNTALYSGYDKLWDIPWGIMDKLDYLKLGYYNEDLGGLDKKSTNQKMYMVTGDGLEDITHEFWH